MSLRLAAVAALALSLLCAAPAAAGEPTMPLRSLRAGMHCTAKSVVRGTAISSFNADIVDVIAGDPAFGGPRILVHVSGAAIAATGIGPGFSGSPIYCRDTSGVLRNAGAISESVGDYGNFYALATPIEEILSETPAPVATSARHDPGLRRAARPLAGPISVSGLSPRTRALLRRAGRRVGIAVLAAPRGPLGGYPTQTLRPGASVGVTIADGDVALGSTGTVAYRDGNTIWAFGHSLESAGARSLFLQDAYVFGVIGNPVGSEDLGAQTYKLATSEGHTVGTLTNDADSAVVGRLGAPPRSVALRTSARDLDTGGTAFVDAGLADERSLGLGAGLSIVSPLAVSQAEEAVVHSAAPVTLQLCARFSVAQVKRRFGYCNSYFDLDSALSDLGSASDLVDRYDLSPLDVKSVSARMRLRHGVKEDVLVSGRALHRVRAGGRVKVRLKVRRRRGGMRRLTVRLRVPRSLRAGVHLVTLKGSGTGGGGASFEIDLSDELAGAFDDTGLDSEPVPEAHTVGELVSKVKGLRRGLGITARYTRRGSRKLVYRSGRVQFTGTVRVPLRVLKKKQRR